MNLEMPPQEENIENMPTPEQAREAMTTVSESFARISAESERNETSVTND